MRVLVLVLLLPTLLLAAPRLKDKGYVPDGWIDELVNAPIESKPWMEMERRTRSMKRAEWVHVGMEMSRLMQARFRRLGIEPVPSIFDEAASVQSDWKLERDHVSGTFSQYKWIELHKGDTGAEWVPPFSFWETGKKPLGP